MYLQPKGCGIFYMKQNVKVTIEDAEGGIVVCVYHGEKEDKKVVYKNIKKAAKAIPAIFSVGEAEAPEIKEKDLEKEKAKLPKADY